MSNSFITLCDQSCLIMGPWYTTGDGIEVQCKNRRFYIKCVESVPEGYKLDNNGGTTTSTHWL